MREHLEQLPLGGWQARWKRALQEAHWRGGRESHHMMYNTSSHLNQCFKGEGGTKVVRLQSPPNETLISLTLHPELLASCMCPLHDTHDCACVCT